MARARRPRASSTTSASDRRGRADSVGRHRGRRLQHRARAARARRAERPSRARTAGVPIQVAFEYSDGAGQTFVKKVQAEPDPAVANGPVRWIANGKTVVNNKGKPVLQYEPYFSVERPPLRGAGGGRRLAGHVLRRPGPPRSHRVPGRHAEPRRVLALVQPQLRSDRHRARAGQPLVRRAHGRRPPSADDRAGARRAARCRCSAARRHAGRGPLRQPRPRSHRDRAQPHAVRRSARTATRRWPTGRGWTNASSPSPSSTPKASRCGSATRAAIS